MTTHIEDFARQLRELKERSGHSYGVLATQLHFSTSTLHRYCNGTAVPADYAPVERFAQQCGANSDELMTLHRRWLLADAMRRREPDRAWGASVAPAATVTSTTSTAPASASSAGPAAPETGAPGTDVPKAGFSNAHVPQTDGPPTDALKGDVSAASFPPPRRTPTGVAQPSRGPWPAPQDGQFGRLLRDLRVRAGLSHQSLSQAAGVSVRAVADLERGRGHLPGPQRCTVQALADALGLDAAGARMLEQAAGLGRPRRPRPGAGPGYYDLLQLPRDIGDFTARTAALTQLSATAEAVDPARPPVALVCGPPGLGKTSFAVHAAHTLAPRFPDGQFAVDLRGMDPEPVAAHAVLARLLRALGVPDHAVPDGLDERLGLFRSVTWERSLLLLLDNAADEDQVRPLLPATGRILTLVTSRHALAGLEAVHRIELGVLRREESVELLTRIIGSERIQAQAQAARDLADLCGNLPLAVRIAGQRLAARPRERLDRLVAQLAREEGRLDALEAGGLQVRAAFALSYHRLDAAHRTLLRRASLAAGPDFSAETAALLADLPLRQAVRCAEDLVDAGLLEPHPLAERYRFHDLLRLFATEQADTDDDTAARRQAQDRTAWWVLRRARAAALHFDADHQQARPHEDPDTALAPADRDQARAWLEAERHQWLAALHHSGAAGRHRQVIDTAEAMHWFSDLTQHWDLWVEVFRRSVDAARALGSRQEEAVHLNYLSWAHNTCAQDHQAALSTAEQALAAAREVGDALQTGWALGYAAAALHRLGRSTESIAWLRDSAACLEAVPSPQGRLAELSTLNTLGRHLRQIGRAEQALAIHERSEAICRPGIPGLSLEVVCLYHAAARQHLGNDLAALERFSEAEEPLRAALAVFEAADMPSWGAPVRLDLAIVLHRLGRYREAYESLLIAEASLGELGHPRHPEAVAELREVERRPSTCQ
ncbi:helix-turn-helix domain-containing protein [Streptomyces sp. NPDC004296]|uniref:helix-turn-helix domain-containing protein n=1 Tax=Streptomyces sp. NPDC004296 TaxID=3364697 RepID=UPI0036B98BB1